VLLLLRLALYLILYATTVVNKDEY